jgi:hypothetical protein
MVQMRMRGVALPTTEPARRDPELQWLPLLVFGALVLAQAPVLARSGLGAGPPPAAAVGSAWLVALLCGAAATAAWFGWLRRAARVTAPCLGAVLVWCLGAAAVWVLGTEPLAEVLPGALGVRVQQDGGLVVMGLGFLALAYEQRSRSIAVAAAALTAVAVWCTLSSADGPGLGPASAALLPAAVLLVGAGLAWRASVRCRV